MYLAPGCSKSMMNEGSVSEVVVVRIEKAQFVGVLSEFSRGFLAFVVILALERNHG